MARFVPADFDVPARLETSDFLIRMLAITDVVKDGRLYDTLRAWIEGHWPFKAVAYPGREMSWETFAALQAAA